MQTAHHREWQSPSYLFGPSVFRGFLSSVLAVKSERNVNCEIWIFLIVVWIQRRHRFVRFSRQFLESHIRCDAACKWARISSNDLFCIHRSVDGIFTYYSNTCIAFMLPLRTIDAAHSHTQMGYAAQPYSPSHVGVAAKATTTITANAELDKFTSIIPIAKTLNAQETFIQSSFAVQTSRENSSLCSRNKISSKLTTFLTSTDRKIHRHILGQIVQLDCVWLNRIECIPAAAATYTKQSAKAVNLRSLNCVPTILNTNFRIK